MPASRDAGADLRRRVPAVEPILQEPAVRELAARHGRPVVVRHLRRLLDEARARATAGDTSGLEEQLAALLDRLARRLEEAAAASLVPVINATGVVIHTNLGRAPLSAEAIARVTAVASSYSNLELDLASGERGQREVHVESRLRELSGAEGAVVVNNNAAAVLLAVNTLAEGREVLVSRGELVEIGGSFRIPDVVRKGSARLREVGTTNRTRLADYRSAIGPETALILKVHPSNFRIVGFTEAPTLAELTGLARTAGLPLVEDLGSGLIAPIPGLDDEPIVARSLEAGVDLVTFSGDKLLGGPQAGLVVGRREVIGALRSNPLYRALRVDKMTMAALAAVLLDHDAGRGDRIPVVRMLSLPAEAVRDRARALAERLRSDSPGLAVDLIEGRSAVGGGAAPTTEIPTFLLALAVPGRGAEWLATALRAATPPVVARVLEDRVVLDLRTVAPEEEPPLRRAVAQAAAR